MQSEQIGADASFERLLDELGRLPGIGPKSAQRIAYHLLSRDIDESLRLAHAIIELKQQVHFCPICFNYATQQQCSICMNTQRDATRICVVSEPKDIQAIERTQTYSGLYHVLGGALSPLHHVGPADLHIQELMARLASNDIVEIIMATNPDVEGETTAAYLARLIKPLGISVTRLASGLPVGGELEYVDELTLGRAIEARQSL